MINMIKEEFFSTYNINEQDLVDAAISWDELLAIEAETRNAQICDYVVKLESCEQAADQILESLLAKE